ncbi:MAG: DUF58 domain-containing protein [Desulfobacteraceae bacterium]|nr:MAG: DUF58 domain-containing protein [Desulfobacteraceae bacterium]
MARRYIVKIAPSGYIYIVVTILISVAAINTGNNLLYIISSLMLALMAVSGAASFFNLFFIDVELHPPEEIFAGIPARFSLTTGKKRGSSFFLKFTTPYGFAVAPFLSGVTEQGLWLTFPERGEISISDVRIRSGFPLGFFYRSKIQPVELKFLVYPKPMATEVPLLSGGSIGGERRSDSRLGEMGDEVKELRGYRESDPLKSVDWKATARRGRMIVREFYHLEGDTLFIELSKKTGGWERKLSSACHLILEGHRKKLLLAMNLPHRKFEPGKGETQKKNLLEALALA